METDKNLEHIISKDLGEKNWKLKSLERLVNFFKQYCSLVLLCLKGDLVIINFLKWDLVLKTKKFQREVFLKEIKINLKFK